LSAQSAEEDVEQYNTPQKMQWEEASKLKEAALGGLHTLFLCNFRVYSCGNNDFGQLGQETSRKRPRTLKFRM
jgi:E3 ubiquitin-protein ligase HERC4